MTTKTLDGRVAGTLALILPFLLLLTPACTPPAPGEHDHSHDGASDHGHGQGEIWSVTVFGERFEAFAEVSPLQADQTTTAHVHVTRLEEFVPLAEGRVELVLVADSGEQVFAADSPSDPGHFSIEVRPSGRGDADLLFRVDDGASVEEIPAGRVRVGAAHHPAGLLSGPVLPTGSDGGAPVSFLKEQQWQGRFATAWVEAGRLPRSVSGVATLRPPAGGESTVTAQVDGVVQPSSGDGSWPFVGRRVATGAPLFRIVPLVAAERSLATLAAEVQTLAVELESARSRGVRLGELLAVEAVSQREVEEAGVRIRSLEVRHQAAARDLESARLSREGGVGADGITLKAPVAGRIAAVTATPGATVAAGDALARVVRTDVVWMEVALTPRDARLVMATGLRGLVLDAPESEPIRLDEGLSLVSLAPELSPRTGTVAVLIESPGLTASGLALGSTVAAQVLVAGEDSGIVVLASALVDDGGAPVVFLQIAGEGFQRQTVTVLARQGDRVLVDGLTPGQRLVTRGGDAIRRSSLLASGEAHGHVH